MLLGAMRLRALLLAASAVLGACHPPSAGLRGAAALNGVSLLRQGFGTPIGLSVNLQQPPALRDAVGGRLVLNLTAGAGADLLGRPVPAQAVVTAGGPASSDVQAVTVQTSEDWMSLQANTWGVSVQLAGMFSAGTAYSHVVQHAFAQEQRTAYASVRTAMPLQQVLLAGGAAGVRFVDDMEAALARLRSLGNATTNATARQYFTFFDEYSAHFMTGYTIGGWAHMSTFVSTANVSHESSLADTVSASLGVAFAGWGASVSTSHSLTQAQYDSVLRASSSLTVECAGGNEALCLEAFPWPAFPGAAAPQAGASPYAAWLSSVSDKAYTPTTEPHGVMALWDVLDARGQEDFAQAMREAYAAYVGQCPHDEDFVCGGHGQCHVSAIGASCACTAGFAGPTCACAAGANGEVCAGRGQCAVVSPGGPGTCKCQDGWAGPTCEQPTCSGDDLFDLADVPCSGHGACTAPGECACGAGWRGQTCSIPCGTNDLTTIVASDPPNGISTWWDVMAQTGPSGSVTYNAKRNQITWHYNESMHTWFDSCIFPNDNKMCGYFVGDAVCQFVFNNIASARNLEIATAGVFTDRLKPAPARRLEIMFGNSWFRMDYSSMGTPYNNGRVYNTSHFPGSPTYVTDDDQLEPINFFCKVQMCTPEGSVGPGLQQ